MSPGSRSDRGAMTLTLAPIGAKEFSIAHSTRCIAKTTESWSKEKYSFFCERNRTQCLSSEEPVFDPSAKGLIYVALLWSSAWLSYLVVRFQKRQTWVQTPEKERKRERERERESFALLLHLDAKFRMLLDGFWVPEEEPVALGWCLPTRT